MTEITDTAPGNSTVKAPLFAIFVNSTDSYEDCWLPFFTLFDRYWPDCDLPIYLNTEHKTFSFKALDIRCTRVAAYRGENPPWGECLRRSLEQIPEEILLYIHEDCFVDRPVRVDLIEQFANKMSKEPDIANIRLVEFDGSGPWAPSSDPDLWTVDRNAAYRLSTQAGLWRNKRLQRHIKSHETPWQFETWGSRRARRAKERILCINRDKYNPENGPVVSYAALDAVRRGKWNLAVVADLFQREKISVDFERRGIFDPENGSLPIPRDPFARRLFARLKSLF